MEAPIAPTVTIETAGGQADAPSATVAPAPARPATGTHRPAPPPRRLIVPQTGPRPVYAAPATVGGAATYYCASRRHARTRQAYLSAPASQPAWTRTGPGQGQNAFGANRPPHDRASAGVRILRARGPPGAAGRLAPAEALALLRRPQGAPWDVRRVPGSATFRVA